MHNVGFKPEDVNLQRTLMDAFPLLKSTPGVKVVRKPKRESDHCFHCQCCRGKVTPHVIGCALLL